MAVKKGLIVGVAVGGLLYVMWRRRRAVEAPSESEPPAWQPQAPEPQEPAAQEPAAEEPAVEEAATDEEVTEDLAEPPAPDVDASAAAEPAATAPAPQKHEEPALHHPGRRLPLTSSGFASRPRVAAFRSSDRPQAAQARISWPGTAAPSARGPRPLRLTPARARPASLRRPR
jgi:hypothetical protein